MRTTLLLAAGAAALTLTACEEPTGACVHNPDNSGAGGTTYYCFDDETQDECEFTISSQDNVTWVEDTPCALVGYPNFCTFEQMSNSPSGVGYAVERWLSNAQCDPTVP